MYRYHISWKVDGKITKEPSFVIEWHYPVQKGDILYIPNKEMTFTGLQESDKRRRFDRINQHVMWKVECVVHCINHHDKWRIELVIIPTDPLK